MLDEFHDPAEAIATVWRKVLRDSHFTEKSGIVLNNLLRRGVAIEIAKQRSDTFDDRGIRFRFKMAMTVLEFGNDPEL